MILIPVDAGSVPPLPDVKSIATEFHESESDDVKAADTDPDTPTAYSENVPWLTFSVMVEKLTAECIAVIVGVSEETSVDAIHTMSPLTTLVRDTDLVAEAVLLLTVQAVPANSVRSNEAEFWLEKPVVTIVTEDVPTVG